MKRLLYATSTEWSEISQSHLDAYLKANELFTEAELRDDLPKFYRNMFNQMKPEDQL